MRKLSPRELQALSGAARGKTTAEAAKELGLSLNTVRVQRESARRKLHASTIAQAVAIGYERGFLPLREVTDDCPWGIRHVGACDCERQFTCNNCGNQRRVKAPASCQLCGHPYGVYVLTGGAA